MTLPDDRMRGMEQDANRQKDPSDGPRACGISLTSEVVQPRPAPVSEAMTPEATAVETAQQVARGWIRRTHHCPMRPTLVSVEDMMNLLREVVASGRATISVEEVLAEEQSPFGRWVRHGRAVALDPVRAAETKSLNAAFHQACASVLVAVHDGRIDEARRLLSEDCTEAARRLEAAVRSWIGAHCEWSADGAVDHAVAPRPGG